MNINSSTESMMYQKNYISRASPQEVMNSNPLGTKQSSSLTFTAVPLTEQAINQAKQSSGVEPQIKSSEQMIAKQQEKREQNANIQLNNGAPNGNLGNNVNLYV
jgi:hypothetical protein